MASDEDTYRAERANTLLNDVVFAAAMTEVKMDALLALATVDPASFKQITQLQAIVHVVDEVKTKLEAAITKTGVRDGGLTMMATRTANTA